MQLKNLGPNALLLLLCGLVGFAASEVTRPHYLDYLDAETMEYYLSAPQEDFDVAVMYYAQWCNNCHSFAPYWDQISRIHAAGTEQSKLIMGLFDCEADAKHSAICNKAGVKHYPTLAFYSLSGQTISLRKPRHGTQFGGNWQYGDAVYDWLKTLSGLSNWHRLGWGKKLRSIFFGKKTKAKDKKLPLGIPGQSSFSLGSTGTGGTASSTGVGTTTTTTTGSDAASEKKIQELEAQVKEYSDMAVRASVLLDAILFPLSTGEYIMETDNKKNVTDLFHLLSDTNGWTSTDSVDHILKTCMMEVALDYCSRLTTTLTNDWVAKQEGLETLTDEVIAAYTNYLNVALPESEPYCLLVEDCILTDFAAEECRPKQCPFQDPAACRYLSACLSPELQAEYAAALQLAGAPASETATGSSSTATDDYSASKPKPGWLR